MSGRARRTDVMVNCANNTTEERKQAGKGALGIPKCYNFVFHVFHVLC